MKTKSYLRWILLGLVIMSSVALYSYVRKSNTRNERILCSERCKEIKEIEDKKTQSDMPIWETLSRHLIALNK
jgi:hypothetical protein